MTRPILGAQPWYFQGRRWYVKDRQGRRYYWYRVVMWDALGRELRPDEEVHHINGDPTDDRVENLEVLSTAEHQRRHLADKIHTRAARAAAAIARQKRVWVECGTCGTAIQRRLSDIPHSKSGLFFCKHACRYEAIRAGIITTRPGRGRDAENLERAA